MNSCLFDKVGRHEIFIHHLIVIKWQSPSARTNTQPACKSAFSFICLSRWSTPSRWIQSICRLSFCQIYSALTLEWNLSRFLVTAAFQMPFASTNYAHVWTRKWMCLWQTRASIKHIPPCTAELVPKLVSNYHYKKPDSPGFSNCHDLSRNDLTSFTVELVNRYLPAKDEHFWKLKWKCQL